MNLAALLSTLVGKRVYAKTIPGNTIDVWLDVPPPSDDAVVLSVHPPWRLMGRDAIIATSAEIPWDILAGETDAEYDERNRSSRAKSDRLVGQLLNAATWDEKTGDLTLVFEDGSLLQCFTVWLDEPPWTLRLYGENRRVGPGIEESIDPPH